MPDWGGRQIQGSRREIKVRVRGQEFSWKALAGVVIAAVLSALPAIRSSSLEGMSEILSGSYLLIWAAALTRFCFHLYEGYAQCGLFRETVFELAIVSTWGFLAVYAYQARDPQIPMLIGFGAAAAAMFFFCATDMESARARLADAAEGQVRLRRASDILRDSSVWDEIFLRVHQLDSERVREAGRWFGGADAEDGMLSRAAFIALCLLAAIALAAGGLAIVGTALGVPLTPQPIEEPDEKKAPDPKRHGDQQNEAKALSSPPGRKRTSAGDDCDPSYRPGPEVPEPQRTALELAWREVDGVPPGPLEALGFDIAGCPGRALPIPGKPRWWYVPGYCEGQLQAVAIAPEGMEHPIVMLEQAAEFTLPLINDGEFVDAVDRFVVGDGDAYVIDSTGGSHVLIREHSTGGAVNGAKGRSGCSDFIDKDVPYTTVDPTLLSGWRSVAAITPGGVYPIASAHDTASVEAVLFNSPAGIVAEGRCWPAKQTCGVKIGSEWIMGEADDHITQEEVEALVEP
jgi:hypothetical protein